MQAGGLGVPPRGRGLGGLIGLLILTLALAGCEITIGPVATPTPGGPVTPQVAVEVTPVDSPTAAPPSPTPGPAGALIKYTVKPGDTLSGIAAQFGVTVDDIVKTNNIEDPNKIGEGDVLLIPPPSANPAPTPVQSPPKVP